MGISAQNRMLSLTSRLSSYNAQENNTVRPEAVSENYIQTLNTPAVNNNGDSFNGKNAIVETEENIIIPSNDALASAISTANGKIEAAHIGLPKISVNVSISELNAMITVASANNKIELKTALEAVKTELNSVNIQYGIAAAANENGYAKADSKGNKSILQNIAEFFAVKENTESVQKINAAAPKTENSFKIFS